MRVTQQAMAQTISGNLFRNIEQLYRTQNILSTGKRINRPSDDPTGMAHVLNYRETIARIEQYQRNILYGTSSLKEVDATLSTVDSLITRAKELAVYQATDTATAQTRAIAAKEINDIHDQIMQLANTSVAQGYLFAGHKIDAPPYAIDTGNTVATYHGDDGVIRIAVGENTFQQINVPGNEVFDGSIDIFQTLHDLKVALENNDTDAISQQIEPLGEGLRQVATVRAEAGARLNRLEATETHWEQIILNITETLSVTEDADLAKTTADLASQEATYQASLAAAAKIIQPSLIDFLR